MLRIKLGCFESGIRSPTVPRFKIWASLLRPISLDPSSARQVTRIRSALVPYMNDPLDP